MSRRIIDISVPVETCMPHWLGSAPPRLAQLSRIGRKSYANETAIEMSVHTGTHIDAPLHFVPGGKSIDKIDPSVFVGPVFVAYLQNVKEITSGDLNKMKLPRDVRRLLFKTSNSSLWEKKNFRFKRNYVGITPDAASWLVRHKIQLVGIDYLSIAKFSDAVAVHRILLKAEVVILEGINLSRVKEGSYQLVCLPVKISNIEAAPARAVILTK